MVIYKRLEKGRFKMPVVEEAATKIELDGADLAMLLDGIDPSKVRRPRWWRPPPPEQRLPKRQPQLDSSRSIIRPIDSIPES